MITLEEIKEYLEDCETDTLLTVDLCEEDRKRFLDIYIFDGLVDDNVYVCSIKENLDIKTNTRLDPWNGFVSFEGCKGFEHLDDDEDDEKATIKDYVNGLLQTIRWSIALDVSDTLDKLELIDNFISQSGFEKIKIETCSGRKF
jgi:hypothetical protein